MNMNALIARLVMWVKSKKWSTHAMILGVVGLAGLIASDQQVQQYITGSFSAHPKIAADIIGLALIIAKVTISRTTAATVAHANVIMSGPNPPTKAEVKSATPPPN